MLTIVQRHKIKGSLQQLLLWVLLCLFAVSCTTDETFKHPSSVEQPDARETEMKITINTPPTTIPETKSRAQTAGECEINEIRVLVFQNGKYAYAADGTISAQEDYSTTFSATLLSTSSPVTLFLIANANASIDNAGIETGDASSVVKSKILYSFTQNGMAGSFPMYGEYSMPSIDASGSAVSGIKMLRSIARADIFIDDEVANFEMVSVQLFRAKDRMQVVPDAVTNMSVSTPSVPDEANGSINTLPLAVSGNESVSRLYFPESAAAGDNEKISGATCIVVGGKYNNSPTVTYYRIDFNLGIDGHPFGQILRNHKYVFNILSVNVSGKTTPEEAANGQSMGIITEVQTWDENTSDMWYEGDQYFGVSSRSVTLRAWANSFGQKEELIVNTNLNSYTVQWVDANGQPLDGSAPSTSEIVNTDFRVKLVNNTIQVTALTDNMLDDERNNYFVIRAGYWNIVISIRHEGQKSRLNELVRVLSFTEIGDLGNGYASDGLLGANGAAMRGILNAQFGPGGRYKIGGYHFTEMGVITSASSLSPNTMGIFDVIFFPHNNQPNATITADILKWLEAKPNRVLVVAADATNTNPTLLSSLNDGLTWSFSNSGSFNFVTLSDENKIFTQGIFGNVSASSTFAKTDAVWGGSTIKANNNDIIVPLLQTSTDGRMVMGVNMSKRIVYIGDCNMFHVQAGGLTNSTGTVNNDPSRLMANLWSWITEIVLSGRNSA